MPAGRRRCERRRGGSPCCRGDRTTAPPDSANWNWWERSEARTGDAVSATPLLSRVCACRSYPSPDVVGPYPGTPCRVGAGISRTPDAGVSECHQRHRHQEFVKFLRRLDKEFPGKVPLHLVVDNYGTHKHEKVREWLKRHPR